MGAVYFLFSATNRFGGRLIRAVTGGKYDHIALYSEDTTQVYEVSFRNNIFSYPMVAYSKANPVLMIHFDTPLDYHICMDWMRARRNVRYDWWRTFAYPFRRFFKGGRKDALNCVEFAEGIANVHGYQVVGNTNASPDEFLAALVSQKLR
jgi:hypothetical protein